MQYSTDRMWLRYKMALIIQFSSTDAKVDTCMTRSLHKARIHPTLIQRLSKLMVKENLDEQLMESLDYATISNALKTAGVLSWGSRRQIFQCFNSGTHCIPQPPECACIMFLQNTIWAYPTESDLPNLLSWAANTLIVQNCGPLRYHGKRPVLIFKIKVHLIKSEYQERTNRMNAKHLHSMPKAELINPSARVFVQQLFILTNYL